MKLVIKLLVFFLIISSSLYCQHEADNWYFGDHVGLNFSSGDPAVLEDSEMYSSEACATISNQDGELLFYTNGEKIWNKEHSIMPNGDDLMGHSSTSQGALIIKQPQTDSIYYLFTVNTEDWNKGFGYSIVDMTLDSGRGDINEIKNIQVYFPTDEKLTALRSSDGVGYWIIIKETIDHIYRAYYFDHNGLDTIPVISDFNEEFPAFYGYLKPSQDCSKLVALSIIENAKLYEFNNTSGVLSNPILLEESIGYSAEFSLNSQVLYISGSPINNTNLIQFDLSEYDEESINSSYYNLNTFGTSEAIQIAPDGKIYCVNPNVGIDRINNPNALGNDCDYEQNVIVFEEGNCLIGLPNFPISKCISFPIYNDPRITMPNIFTPNNDGINDRFIPLASSDVYNPIITIYNRWGIEVYKGDLRLGWDGYQFKDGVYYWVIKYKDQNGINRDQNGSVTLTR